MYNAVSHIKLGFESSANHTVPWKQNYTHIRCNTNSGILYSILCLMNGLTLFQLEFEHKYSDWQNIVRMLIRFALIWMPKHYCSDSPVPARPVFTEYNVKRLWSTKVWWKEKWIPAFSANVTIHARDNMPAIFFLEAYSCKVAVTCCREELIFNKACGTILTKFTMPS